MPAVAFAHAPLPRARPRALWTCELYRRALCVDYGLSRIGLATSLGFSAAQLPNIAHPGDASLAARCVARAARAASVKDIVVGLPLTALGAEGDQAAATRAFVAHLCPAAPWADVLLVDERFSTQVAAARLREEGVGEEGMKALIDGAAAAEIASRFFGGEGAEVVQRGVRRPEDDAQRGGQDTVDGSAVEAASYFAWKKSAMARAAEAGAGQRRRRRKKKK